MQRRRRCGLLPATCRGADKGGVSLFEKEIPLPYTLPEKICIASVQLEELRRLPIATCCARQSRVERCYTTCLCSYYPLLRSRWRLCCLTDAAHPLRSLGGPRGPFSHVREWPPFPYPPRVRGKCSTTYKWSISAHSTVYISSRCRRGRDRCGRSSGPCGAVFSPCRRRRWRRRCRRPRARA